MALDSLTITVENRTIEPIETNVQDIGAIISDADLAVLNAECDIKILTINGKRYTRE